MTSSNVQGTEPGKTPINAGGSPLRRLVHFAVPSNFHDPVGLSLRLLRSGSQGRFAMFLAGLNLVATPLDYILSIKERELYRRAESPRLPMVFICGPPRSGTTLVANVLAHATPVAYFTNLTALFPRSPITASRLFRAPPCNKLLTTRSHYGRAAGFRGWNDGLHLWDRWLGRDRQSVCHHIDEGHGAEMARFFGAFEKWSGLPLVNKNNALNAHAALISAFLPSARFVCLERDPLYLAQSLLIARSYIHGSDAVPYGLDDPQRPSGADPVAGVCQQVRYHQTLAEQQAAVLGSDRFRVVAYEDFCRNPRAVIREIARAFLGVPVDESRVPDSLRVSRTQRIPEDVFQRLRSELEAGSPR